MRVHINSVITCQAPLCRSYVLKNPDADHVTVQHQTKISLTAVKTGNLRIDFLVPFRVLQFVVISQHVVHVRASTQWLAS